MLPLAAWAGEVKVTKPVLTLENDTLTLDFKFNMEAVKVNITQSYALSLIHISPMALQAHIAACLFPLIV